VARACGDHESSCAQHRFDTGVVRRPPIRRIARQGFFDERHFGPAWFRHRLARIEIQIIWRIDRFVARNRQRLKNQQSFGLRRDEIQGEEWITKVVENAHEKHQVETRLPVCEIVHLAALDFNLARQFEAFDDPARLFEEMRILVQRDNVSAASSELHAVETGVTTEVESTPAGEICWKMRGNFTPLEIREVAQRVVGRRLGSVGQMDVMEPRLQSSRFCRESDLRLFRMGHESSWIH
jgi:hypothetical protein